MLLSSVRSVLSNRKEKKKITFLFHLLLVSIHAVPGIL